MSKPHGGWGVTRIKRVNTCHPSKKHYANGLCRKCYQNTPAFKAMRHRYYEANIDKFRADTQRALRERRHVTRTHGVSAADLMAMLETQQGRCAICGDLPKRKRLAFDHCHATGRPRAFLCHPCNGALGLFKDSPELLEKAIAYLRLYSRHDSLRAESAPEGTASSA